MKVIPARYIADDGKVFNTEEECLEYEQQKKSIHKTNFIMLDGDLNQAGYPDEAIYCRFYDEDAFRAFSCVYGWFQGEYRDDLIIFWDGYWRDINERFSIEDIRKAFDKVKKNDN